MEQELKDLKSALRSLVVSSPTQMDVRSLLRDYRNIMGAPVPIAKYGYRDPVQFLRERCDDCFVCQGPPSNPVLTLIVPDALKHIDQFVQKQKVSSTAKFKGKRRSIPEQVLKQRDLVVHTFVPRAVEMRNTHKSVDVNNAPARPVAGNTLVPRSVEINNNTNKIKTPTMEKDINEKPEEFNSNHGYSRTNIRSLMSVRTLSNLNLHVKEAQADESTAHNKENSQGNANGTNTKEPNYQNAVHNFLKKRIPMYSSTQNMESEMSYNGKVSSKGDNDSGRLTSSSNNSTKAALLEDLKIEIRDLIADHPEGVFCVDLIGLYRERYKRELNFSSFGSSIINLVCLLEDVIHISQSEETGQWLLKDVRAESATATRTALARRYLPVTVARVAHSSSRCVDVDDALPGIDFDPDVFPVDCVHFMQSIPAPSLSGLETGAMVDVVVGEVYSPSHFWLLRLGEQHNIAMENLMDEMTEYYTHGEGKDRWLALGAVQVGHYCSSEYERDWHRSLIVRRVDSDTVKVRHVDYGTVTTTPTARLKPLVREWAALPAQALRARLAGVRPSAGGRRWPHAASARLLGLVRNTRFVANVVAVDREEDILEVFLIDTSADEDLCVSAEMIRSGHADARDDCALGTSECYLFPRFSALEAGATPNFAEIHAYLRDGISLDYVEEYRMHVPACLPPPTPPTPSEPSSPASSAPASPAPPSSPAPAFSSNQPLSIGGYSCEDDSAVSVGASEASDDEDGLAQDEPRTPPAPPTTARLARSASSPGEAPPLRPPPRPPRSNSAHLNVSSNVEAVNRVPLWPLHAPATPPLLPPSLPPLFLPPVRTPVIHAYPQLLPVPGYAGFPPFPGAVPLYPPVYQSPGAPLLLPHYAPCRGPPPPPPPPRRAPVVQVPPQPHRSPTGPASSQPPQPPAGPATPPPPYEGALERTSGQVTLSVSECEIFKLLSSVDANAAHWYMVDAISRAMRVGDAAASSTLDPEAPEFPGPPRAPDARASLPPHAPGARAPLQPYAPGARAPLPPRFRPPPSFGG